MVAVTEPSLHQEKQLSDFQLTMRLLSVVWITDKDQGLSFPLPDNYFLK